MNSTTTTSHLAALALAHGFAPDRATSSAQSRRVIYIDFGRLSLGVAVKTKERRSAIREKRAQGFWGYFSEQVVYGLLAVAALSGSLAFVVLG
jgi:hypothetical protein